MAASALLQGQGFVLRPFAEDLISARYIAWLNDRQLMQYSRQRFLAHTPQSCRAFTESYTDSPHYFWGIIADDPALGHIGNMTANVDLHNCVADLTILVGEAKAQGKGFGLAAWSLAMSWLLGPAGFRKVAAGTMAVNTPMIRIMQKSGMVEDGNRSRHFLYQEREVDCVMYAKFAASP
jgi:[ribosomal protein S5]-alanine N-acetyltransferase